MMMRWTLTAALLASTTATGALAQATGGTLDGRVGKLEKEMKAVQRTVFPQGVPVQPDAGAPAPATAPGSPSSTPIADLTARVDALEKSVATLTGQVEQALFTNKQQDETIKRLEARLNGLEGGTATGDAPAASVTATSRAAPPGSALAKPAPAKPAPSPAKPDPARRAAIAAVEMPATGDAAEDAYTYGFRLYSAKLYPEAQAKLKEFVAQYPKHKRASYAQNLLGRAYLDEGKPALASVAFYDNYQKMPKGDRAAESLYWLGQSLIRLKKLPDACKVYDELADVYGATMSADLKARAAKGRADAKCAA